jgi:hypothetical protein
MSTAVVYGLDEDDVGDDDDDDDSVMLVSEKPAARPPPGKKAPFKCVPGEVLRVMQDRLASNASKNNVASSSLGTLKAMFADLVQCRGPLLKIAKELDHRMEIVGEGKPVLIADLLLKAIPFEVTKRTSSKSEIAATFMAISRTTEPRCSGHGIQGSMTFHQATRGGESEQVWWRVRRRAGDPRTLLSSSSILPNG